MIKIAAITAAIGLLVIAAIVVLAYKAGRKAEQLSGPGVERKLHQDMARFVSDAVSGTSLDSEYWASLSPQMLERGEKIVTRYRSSIGN